MGTSEFEKFAELEHLNIPEFLIVRSYLRAAEADACARAAQEYVSNAAEASGSGNWR
jgi:hypothetical protein